MKRLRAITVLILLIEAAALRVADRRRPYVPEPPPDHLPYLGTSITTFTASPGTVTFTSSDPDAGASATATISVGVNNAGAGKPWSVQVQAAGTTLTNCSAVPVSSVTAVCNSVGVGGTGSNNPTGNCRASFPLSTTPNTIASGTEGDKTDSYTINMTYQFADAWKYPGASSPACSMTLTYTVSIGT